MVMPKQPQSLAQPDDCTLTKKATQTIYFTAQCAINCCSCSAYYFDSASQENSSSTKQPTLEYIYLGINKGTNILVTESISSYVWEFLTLAYKLNTVHVTGTTPTVQLLHTCFIHNTT
jgi:hypothetical protein